MAPGAAQTHETDRNFQKPEIYHPSEIRVLRQNVFPFLKSNSHPIHQNHSECVDTYYMVSGWLKPWNPTLVPALSSTFVNRLQLCHRQPPSNPMFSLTTRSYHSSHSSEPSENISTHWPFQHGSNDDRRHYQRCSSRHLFGSGIFLLHRWVSAASRHFWELDAPFTP